MMKDPDLHRLIEKAQALHLSIKESTERYKEIQSQIVDEASRRATEMTEGRGGGRQWACTTNNGIRAVVSFPAPSLKPSEDAIAQARQSLEPGSFKKLFESVTTWRAVKSFRDVARALLTPARAEKLIAACEVPGSPRLSFSEVKEG